MRSSKKAKSKKIGKIKPKKNGKAKEQQPKKKVGRPSNAELAERAKVKRHEHDAVREELLAAIAANVSPQGNTDASATPTLQPKYPVFFIGEQVCYGWWEILYEGHVVEDPDPVNCAMARVKWDDGRIQWHAKENLRSMHKANQRKVKRVVYGDQQRGTRNLEGTSSIE